MTIDEAIHYLERIKQEYDCSYDEDALNMAMASLEAWQKVRQEINNLFEEPAFYMPNYDAYRMFLEIIDKHLQEGSDKE